MRFVQIFSLVLLVVSMVSHGVEAQDPSLDDLIRQLPMESNSVLLINAKALAEAPPAVMEKWTANYAAANSSSPLALPEGVQYVAMSTEFDIQHMAPLQQTVALSLGNAVDAAAIAKVRDGAVDQIAGTDVVWINEACVFVNSEKQVSVVSPMNRQSAARWLKRTGNATESALSDYLNGVIGSFAGGEDHVVMAVDLSNVFSMAAVKSAVQRSRIFAEADQEAVSGVIGSVQGVSIRCGLVYESCTIQIDFGQSIKPLEAKASEFVNAALSGAGAKLGDAADWDIQLADTQIQLTGKLTPSIMQRIFSLNTLAAVAGSSSLTQDEFSGQEAETTAPETESSRPSAQERIAQRKLEREAKSTKRYFDRITDMLNDVGIGDASHTLRDDALWLNNYSRALLSASTSSVDPVVVKHGEYVARSLENIVSTFHNTQGRTAERQWDNRFGGGSDIEVTAIPTRRYNFNGNIRHRYAPMYRRNFDVGSSEERFQIEDEEISRANDISFGILNQVAAEHEQVRQEMTKKYGIQF